MDWIPGLSQLKSTFQLVTGDFEGAAQTQENFVKTCPLVSQITSAVQVIAGDEKGARETQKAFLNTVGGVANGLPVVGHVKGIVHYACGDKDGGDQAMKSSSRSVGVIGGGIGGFFVAGPVGAIAGGITGGTAMDAITTAVDSAVHDEYRPAGHIATVTEIVENIENDQHPAGKIFDFAAGVAFDGLAGKAAGKSASKIAGGILKKSAFNTLETIENNPNLSSGQIVEQSNAAMAKYQLGEQLQGVTKTVSKDGGVSYSQPMKTSPPVSLSGQNKDHASSADFKTAKSANQNTNTSTKASENNNCKANQNNSKTENQSNQSPNNNNPNNNNPNNNNPNNNNGSGSKSNDQTDEQSETIEWFNGLRLGIRVSQNSPELRRLVQVRAQMILLQNNCPGFFDEAIRFAREMGPRNVLQLPLFARNVLQLPLFVRNVSQFCNFLKFFETEFISEREKLIRMNNQDYQNETANQKSKLSKKKWASMKALKTLNPETVKTSYQTVKNMVNENKMVDDQMQSNPQIQTSLDRNDLIQLVRTEASNNNIRFGSVPTAAYHIRLHATNPMQNYVLYANRLIAGASSIIQSFTINRANNETTIDIEFKDPKTNKTCVVLVKNGHIILKTYY